MQITVSRTVASLVGAAVVACAAALGFVTGAAAQQTVTYPAVLSGDQIGFRPIAPGSATGVLVIQIDGQWVPAQFPQEGRGIVPLTR